MRYYADRGMQISGHYAGFPEKTLVVIVNHERARMFSAYGHDFCEQPMLQSAVSDSQDEEVIKTFFTLVHKRMEEALEKEGFTTLLVCVPEIHRPLFQQHTPPPLAKRIQRLVPKNLSAMEEGPIIRILFEG
jgi:hypothetical protein